MTVRATRIDPRKTQKEFEYRLLEESGPNTTKPSWQRSTWREKCPAVGREEQKSGRMQAAYEALRY